MTTFALVHGAWHDETSWDLVAPLLAAEGHAVVAPRLPGDDPEAGYEEYAEVVLDALAQVREPPVLVGHSLASETIPLVAMARPVRLLVYVCPRLGGYARPAGVEEPTAFRARLGVRVDDLGRTVWKPEDAVRAMYSRLDPALAARAAAGLRPQADTRSRPYPLAGPPPTPAAMIRAAEDDLFRAEWSTWAARELLGVEPIRLPGGHFPMLERPHDLALVLLGLAAGAAPPAEALSRGPGTGSG